jgi:hypothetical protein
MLCARPLLPTEFAQTSLDITEDQLAALVDEGLLYPVFNICAANSCRKELRILAAGLIYYAGTKHSLPADPDQVCVDLFPPDAPVTTVSLQRTLNCGGELVRGLVKSGQLTLMPGEALKQGPGGAAKISRQSAIAFLKKRVV